MTDTQSTLTTTYIRMIIQPSEGIPTENSGLLLNMMLSTLHYGFYCATLHPLQGFLGLLRYILAFGPASASL